ncbi:JmjC domain-containing protein [Streptomyces sp. NPDC006285]|uniref:JmjC domain-containing protein n=1 Tax=Streptomyces sp. NPDC006285 TaxID=3364742 RepID=UPI0036C0442C
MPFEALSLLVSDPDNFLQKPPREPVQFCAAPEAVRDLFTYRDVDDLLTSRKLRFPNVSLVNSSLPAPAGAYADKKFPTSDVADALSVAAYLQNGYSITFNQLHHFLPPLGDLASRLEYEVGCPVEVTAFVTPPGAKALGPHHDTISTFLCQTEGTKHWKLYRPVQQDPHPDEAWDWAYLSAKEQERILSGKPDMEVSLEPGQCLWIPRGWIHSATVDPDTQTSVHLTLEIRRESRYWLARQLVDYLGHIPYFREDLAAGQTLIGTQDDGRTADFLQTVAKAVAATDAADFRRYADHQHRSRFGGPKIRPIQDVLEVDQLPLPTALFKAERARGYEMNDGVLRLHLGGAERMFDGAQARLLLSLLQNEPAQPLLPIIAQTLGDEEAPRFLRILLALGLAAVPSQRTQPPQTPAGA